MLGIVKLVAGLDGEVLVKQNRVDELLEEAFVEGFMCSADPAGCMDVALGEVAVVHLDKPDSRQNIFLDDVLDLRDEVDRNHVLDAEIEQNQFEDHHQVAALDEAGDMSWF